MPAQVHDFPIGTLAQWKDQHVTVVAHSERNIKIKVIFRSQQNGREVLTKKFVRVRPQDLKPLS